MAKFADLQSEVDSLVEAKTQFGRDAAGIASAIEVALVDDVGVPRDQVIFVPENSAGALQTGRSAVDALAIISPSERRLRVNLSFKGAAARIESLDFAITKSPNKTYGEVYVDPSVGPKTGIPTGGNTQQEVTQFIRLVTDALLARIREERLTLRAP